MEKLSRKIQIGVIGYAGREEYPISNRPLKKTYRVAEEVGYLLASQGITVVTGGKGGIMESSEKGAKKAGGITVGVVKGKERFTSNKFTDVEIISGMEQDGFDEFLLVCMCDALIVIGGGAGTLQEIAIAYRNKKPIIVLKESGGWAARLTNQYLDERKRIKIEEAKTPKQAVEMAVKLINRQYEPNK